MKITIVQGAFLPVPPLLGGAVEKVWQALAHEFAAQGHEVVHISRQFRDLAEREIVKGVAQIRVRGHDTPTALWRLKLLDLCYTLRVRRVLPAADILVSNTFWLPAVTRHPRFGHPYIHVARFPRGQLKLYPSRATFQTVSSTIGDAIRQELSRASHPRIVVVPYPLTEEAAPETPINARPRTILYAGRIHPEKGLSLLVEAFRLFSQLPSNPAWTLRLVGPWEAAQGGGGSAFRDQLLRLGQGLRLEIPGPEFSHQALLKAYGQGSLFVYPSLAEKGETFGLAVLEAMSAGTPPIVSDLACFKDFVVSGQNGLVFDHRAERPSHALAGVLAVAVKDTELRERLSQNALTTAAGYRLHSVARAYLDDFAKALVLGRHP